jgi:hypothetical protein
VEANASEDEINDALVKVAVASVERLEEAVRQHKTHDKCSWVSPNFWELAKEHRMVESDGILLPFYYALEPTSNVQRE